MAKAQLFGHAEDNVKYAKGVEVELRSLGHHVQLIFADRKQVIQELLSVVLQEEKTRLKRLKQTMDREMQLQFIQQWKKDNEIYLNEVFGMADAMLDQKTEDLCQGNTLFSIYKHTYCPSSPGCDPM